MTYPHVRIVFALGVTGLVTNMSEYVFRPCPDIIDWYLSSNNSNVDGSVVD